MNWLRHIIGSLLLMIFTPVIVYAFWFTAQYLDGSFALLYQIILKHGVMYIIAQIPPKVFFGSLISWGMVWGFALFEIILYLLIPGKKISGPPTKNGFIPTYKENGITCYLITIVTFCLFSFGLDVFSPTIIFDRLGEIIGTLFWSALGLCLFLYVKGRLTPSPGEHSTSGSFIFDFFWGIELYPALGRINIKHLTNCRIAMMSWPLILFSYAAAQHVFFGLANSMLVSVALQTIYVTKFFLWEKGYLRSMDIAHDRAGYYIIWGVLVWLPMIYTSPALYLVHHPYQLPNMLAIAIFLLGGFAIMINYLADKQRVEFREKEGKIRVWGRDPKFTIASYEVSNGAQENNLLLASGFWGVARHFHYIPELLGAFLWSLPALFTHFYPYFYVSYLAILLVDRARRDDHRCAQKYGKAWESHCAKVPYKIFPYLY